jgi:YD repeat-containing protein
MAGVVRALTFPPRPYGSEYLTEQSTLVGTQNIVTTHAYDRATGSLLSTTDPDGQTTSYQYDSLGRVTVTTYPAVNGISATTRNAYDDATNVLTATDADGHEGMHLARELELTFPKERNERLLSILKSLQPENFEMMKGEGVEDPYADDGGFAGEAVTLSW